VEEEEEVTLEEEEVNMEDTTIASKGMLMPL